MNPARPTPWTQRPLGGATAVDRAAELMRAGDASQLLDPYAVTRALAKISERQRAKTRWSGLRFPRRVIAVMVFVLAPVALAAFVKYAAPVLVRLAGPVVVEPVPAPAPSRKPRPKALPLPQPPPELRAEPGASVDAPEAVLSEPDLPQDFRFLDELPKTRSEQHLRAETSLLAQAVGRLRADHDATAALKALDAYDRRFPNGVLKTEARIARVEALLAAGRRKEALGFLDQLLKRGTKKVPRLLELQTLRGELLSEHGRCKEAVPVLTTPVQQGAALIQERALYARAVCRAQTDDYAGGQADLAEYLRRFPSGRFAAKAKAALDR